MWKDTAIMCPQHNMDMSWCYGWYEYLHGNKVSQISCICRMCISRRALFITLAYHSGILYIITCNYTPIYGSTWRPWWTTPKGRILFWSHIIFTNHTQQATYTVAMNWAYALYALFSVYIAIKLPPTMWSVYIAIKLPLHCDLCTQPLNYPSIVICVHSH